MLTTYVLDHSCDDVNSTLAYYQSLLGKLSQSPKTQMVSAIVTSSHDIPTFLRQQQTYQYQYANFTQLPLAQLQNRTYTIMQNTRIEPHQPIIQANSLGTTLVYPIEDSLAQTYKYILPWLPLLSKHIGGQPINIQKHIEQWLMQSADGLQILNFAQYAQSLLHRSRMKPYRFTLTQQQTGRHQLIQSWRIEGPNIIELWHEMQTQLSASESFVLFAQQPLTDPEHYTASTYTLIPQTITQLQQHCKHTSHLDLHASGRSPHGGSFDLVARENHIGSYEFRLIVEDEEYNLEQVNQLIGE